MDPIFPSFECRGAQIPGKMPEDEQSHVFFGNILNTGLLKVVDVCGSDNPASSQAKPNVIGKRVNDGRFMLAHLSVSIREHGLSTFGRVSLSNAGRVQIQRI